MTFWSTVQHIINILYGTLVKPLHLWFNEATEGIDFFALCLVYTLVFLFVAWRTYRAKKWVGPFHELLTFRERVGAFGMKLLRALPIISSVFNKKLAKEESKASKLFDEEFEKSLDARRANCLPENGMNPENLRRRIDEWTKKEYELTRTHKISGSIYYEDEELFEATAAFASNFHTI
jgi:hypothetical protein